MALFFLQAPRGMGELATDERLDDVPVIGELENSGRATRVGQFIDEIGIDHLKMRRIDTASGLE